LNVILDPQYIVEDADRELLASSAPFWLRAKIRNKEAKPEELDVILRENGTIVENALRRAMLKNKKVTCLFLNGRTLIREPVLRWEMCPQREPLAKFVIEGLAIPSSEIVAPEGVYLALSLLKPNQEKAKKHSQQQIDKMTTKLSQTGQTAAVCVDKNLRIVDGHLTYLAAKKLGQDTVRVRILDSDEGKEES